MLLLKEGSLQYQDIATHEFFAELLEILVDRNSDSELKEEFQRYARL